MDVNERESHGGESKPTQPAGEMKCATKSVILHTDPFTIFYITLVGTMIAISLVLPIVQWIREWLR